VRVRAVIDSRTRREWECGGARRGLGAVFFLIRGPACFLSQSLLSLCLIHACHAICRYKYIRSSQGAHTKKPAAEMMVLDMIWLLGYCVRSVVGIKYTHKGGSDLQLLACREPKSKEALKIQNN
jgi:hypothetical protein